MVSKRTGIIAIIVVVAIVFAGIFAAFSLNNNKAKSTGEITIVDALGNNITLNSTPVRVISASPSTTELLYAMGVEEFIVGVTSYCDYPLNATGASPKDIYTNIGGFYSPSFEKIASLNPDIVLIDSSVKKQKDLVPQLESVGIKYIGLYPGKNITQIKMNIDYLGQVFRLGDKAEDVNDEIDQKLSSITEKTSAITSKLKVMVMVSWSPSIYVTGGSTFINDVIQAAGGVNAFGNGTGYVAISKEAVVQANPDVILVCSSMIPGLTSQEVLDQIKNDTLLKTTNAVVNNKVFVISDQAESCFLCSDTRVTKAAYMMTQMLYPTLYGQTIPVILGDEYEDYLPDDWKGL